MHFFGSSIDTKPKNDNKLYEKKYKIRCYYYYYLQKLE